MNAPGYFSHSRPQMRAFVPARARRILDIGCGDGGFAAGLRDERRDAGADMEILGVELDESAADRARSHLDRVLTGSAEARVAELPDRSFDCIVINDVLEHLAWPENLLRSLHRVLTPGGCLVTSIPNVRYIHNVWDLVVRGDWEYGDEGIRDRTHLRFFTRASMRTLLEGAGWRIQTQQGINATGSWRFRVVNLLGLGRLGDMRYLQFACVAVSAKDTES